MTIREAYESSGMTIKEIAECLQVPERTLQDWIYGKRHPKQKGIADKIMAMSILTKERRKSLIIDNQDWIAAMREYKLETALNTSKIRTREEFTQTLGKIPGIVIEQLTAEALAKLIDAIGKENEMEESRIWYAVMQDRQDDDWGTGSRDLEEAKRMCRSYGPEAYIAVIDESNDDPICVEEITQDEF